MIVLPMHEFLLWNNCNNNCKFCWQRKDKQSTKREQIEAIDLTIAYLEDLKDAHVLVIGGEIFAEQDTTIKNRLQDLFLKIIQKMLINEIDNCYINTNLLYNLDSLLLPVLENFAKNSLIQRIHFTTSADDFGRFDNQVTKSLFYKNLLTIREKYPELYIICNIILTDNFCDMILTDEFNIKEYMLKYKVDVNTIPYIKYGTIVGAPTREKALNTLLHIKQQDSDYLLRYLNNFLLGQEFNLHKYVNGKLMDVSADYNPCGHSENFTRCYSDSDNCFICDCAELRTLLYKQELNSKKER